MRNLVVEVVAITAAAVVVICATLGLLPGDGTWWSRTTELLTTVATLSFGFSIVAGEKALAATTHAALLSLAVVVGTTALLLIVAVPLGLFAALRSRDGRVNGARRTVDVVSALPVLVWATVVFVVVARGGGISINGDSRLVTAVMAAILALFLGDRLLSDLVQRVTVRAREVLAEPYMRTVRAAGFGVTRHLLQSIVPAVGEAVSSRAVFLVSGAIVVEKVFSINGLGFPLLRALVQPDEERTLVLALSIALIGIALLLRLTSRAVTLWADPRLRA